MLEAVSRSLDARGGWHDGDPRPNRAVGDSANAMKHQIGEVRSFRSMLAAYSDRPALAPALVTSSMPRR